MQVGNVPHEWLFRQVKAVSHHGGAGTTAAGIRAGVPSIIVPFGGDQPFGRARLPAWYWNKPIMCKKLSVQNYSEALDTAVSNTAMQQETARIGALLRAKTAYQMLNPRDRTHAEDLVL
jgi:UDP:flavonoid glycosyltransferase YjiC (YdhE family)